MAHAVNHHEADTEQERYAYEVDPLVLDDVSDLNKGNSPSYRNKSHTRCRWSTERLPTNNVENLNDMRHSSSALLMKNSTHHGRVMLAGAIDSCTYNFFVSTGSTASSALLNREASISI